MGFGENYLAISDKVVEILKGQCSGGGILEDVVNADNIHWGPPTKENRDVWEGEICIFVLLLDTILMVYSTLYI